MNDKKDEFDEFDETDKLLIKANNHYWKKVESDLSEKINDKWFDFVIEESNKRKKKANKKKSLGIFASISALLSLFLYQFVLINAPLKLAEINITPYELESYASNDKSFTTMFEQLIQDEVINLNKLEQSITGQAGNIEQSDKDELSFYIDQNDQKYFSFKYSEKKQSYLKANNIEFVIQDELILIPIKN